MKNVLPLIVLAGALVQAQPSVKAILNSASNDARFSPGSAVSIYGLNFGTTPTVSVGGKAAAIIGAVDNQVNAQLPVDLPIGAAMLTVTAGGMTSAPFTMTIDDYAPAFFLDQATGAAFSDSSFKRYTNLNPVAPGGVAIAFMGGLGATDPAVATGQAVTQIANTVVKPQITVGGKVADVVFSGLAPGTPGYLYQVNFTVPKDLSGCSYDVFVTAGTKASPKATLPVGTGVPAVCAVQNGANQQLKDSTHGAAPNSFVTIYTSAVGTEDKQNLFPQTDSSGVAVLFNGTPVPLYSLSAAAGLINVVVPSDLPTSGTATVVVKNAKGSSDSATLTLAPADVGIFWLPDAAKPTRRNGIVQVAGTYQLVMPGTLATAYNIPACAGAPPNTTCGQPAKTGDNIAIYLTGCGLATPNGDPSGKPVPTGSIAPADGSILYKTVETPKVTIGGVEVPIQFSGIVPSTAAEYQINVQIPQTGVAAGDDVPVVVTFGTSSDTVTIAVE